jgi:hypothetical protein
MLEYKLTSHEQVLSEPSVANRSVAAFSSFDPSPPTVTPMQLRFASFAVINLRQDLLPEECARAGRTKKETGTMAGFKLSVSGHFDRLHSPPTDFIFSLFSDKSALNLSKFIRLRAAIQNIGALASFSVTELHHITNPHKKQNRKSLFLIERLARVSRAWEAD